MILRNAWYVAAEADEVGRRPLGRILLGEPVVLYRRTDGGAVALEDRCCHRRAPLHKGEVVGDGLQCGYHGFLFDAAGICVKVPGLDRAPPREARVRAYPLCERHRYVWIWMGDPVLADPALVPDFRTNDDPAWAATGMRLPVAADYLLLVDNLLDLSHVAFVHRGTIGSDDSAARLSQERGEGFVRLVREAADFPTPPLYRKQGFGERVDQRKVITFTPPSHVTIEIVTSERSAGAARAARILILNTMTPEGAGSCHYFWASTRDFEIGNAEATAFFQRETARAFDQDKDILEAQQRSIDLAPAAPEIHVPADIGSVQARRLLAQRVAAEGASAAAAQ